ncbi:unnamed protein product [Lymnaea stagnalis]|uniref:Peroxisomal membrane protein PEX14 n=1 Tax=Lymnaea stagnalis TaxID=6523 RepID=A0AAV2IBB0_LYMST
MSQDSGENIVNGDGDKQILAPAEGPRENLISTAVKFLQNPKVMSSPLYQKKAFLEKKGLTQEEISMAVQRSGVKETIGIEESTSQMGPPPGYQPGMMAITPQTVPVYAPIPPQSIWAKTRDLTMTTVIVASVSYAVYQVFQKYLRPWLLGKSEREKRLERLEGQILEVQKSITDSLAEVTKTLTAIQLTLNTQQTQQQIGYGEVRGISDLKADIASLKGLLLNRSQFPPAPATAPVLPSWQRAPNQTPVLQSTSDSGATSLKSYSEAVKMPLVHHPSDGYTATENTTAVTDQNSDIMKDQNQESFVEDSEDARSTAQDVISNETGDSS